MDAVTSASTWYITKIDGGSALYFRECCTEKGQLLWLYGFTNVKPEYAKLKEMLLNELQEASRDHGAFLVEAPKELLESILKEASKYIVKAS
jgi:hypothetical protein